MSVRIAIVGLGYWGRNYPRVLRDVPGAALAALVDAGPALRDVGRRWPDARLFSSVDDVIDSGLADAVIIATPASTHHEIASRCMDAGLHVLVEKPLATTADDARDLERRARRSGRVLLVGHTFLYSPRVEFIRELILSGDLGEIRYLYSRRLNLGKVRDDVDALWNFGPHDVSIAMHIVGERPTVVGARTLSCLGREIGDVSFIHLGFPGPCWAHLHMSWLDPRRVRELTVVGSKQMLTYDDAEMREPIRIYEASVAPAEEGVPFTDWADYQFVVRPGRVVAPYVSNEEPLARLCAHFVRCILDGERPLTPAAQGVAIVEVLEAASRSALDGGREVTLGTA